MNKRASYLGEIGTSRLVDLPGNFSFLIGSLLAIDRQYRRRSCGDCRRR